MKELSFETEFNSRIQSGFPLIGIRTKEVDRVTRYLRSLTEKLNQSLKTANLPPEKKFLKEQGFYFYVWDAVNGWVPFGGQPVPNTDKNPDLALSWITKTAEGAQQDPRRMSSLPGIYIAQNIHMFDIITHQLPYRVQLYREVYEHGKKFNKHLFIVGDFEKLPNELAPYVVMMEFKLPDREQIRTYLKTYTTGLGLSFKDQELKEASTAAAGMTMLEVESALCVSVVESKGTKIDTEIIFGEKAKVVKKSGLLEHIPTDLDMERDVGGLENLKGWTKRVAKSFHNREAADKYKLPVPKGVLVTGCPGTGKTLFAKCVANLFGVPLFKLDMGKLFGGIVGQSERATRDVISLAEAMSPCVLLVDEIEKAMAGMGSSDKSDSGVTARMIGSFLSWMSDKTTPVYIVATANNVTSLPPEMLRKGRFDEVWFLDLPGVEQREQTLSIHIRNKDRDMKKYSAKDISKLAALADGFTGAELEDVVKQAMFHAFYEDREFTVADLERAIKGSTPLKDIKPEEIEAIRKWARDTRARPANALHEAKVTSKSKKGEEASRGIYWTK
jgi:AAA+ superfamily predicted ATPase